MLLETARQLKAAAKPGVTPSIGGCCLADTLTEIAAGIEC
jgi:hypothetical protein